jgi:hypothetical protein
MNCTGIMKLLIYYNKFLNKGAHPASYPMGALSLGVKWQRREAGHSPPSSAEVEECVEL